MNIVRYFLILVLCLAVFTSHAEELPAGKKFYKALGAPSQPLVPAQWNRFHDYTESTELMQQLAKTYPDYCKLKSLGSTYGKREMWLLTITNFSVGDETERPAFWIDAAIHANEIQATEVALYTAWYLLEMRGQLEFVDRLLKERVIYLVPMMSPDSRDAHFYEPNTTHSPRSGQRPIDDDHDGLIDEDGPDDLNGDGHISYMRVRDPLGKYKPHPDFPEIMIPVNKDEVGSFTLLGQEGFDNDGDGEVNEDGDGYYDPNRDWGWSWQPNHIQRGAYRYPLSIPENRLVADFIMTRPNIAGAQSYHNTGGMILHGPGVKSENWDPADLRIYDTLGERGVEMLPGYRSLTTGRDLYEVFGGLNDWMHNCRGAFAVTNELFTPFNYFRQREHIGIFAPDELTTKFDKYLLLGEGLVPWTEIDHPQYGKIEVGGGKKSGRRQPPSFLLEEECHRNMAFTLYHADQMPLVRIADVATKSLGNGLMEITVAVENTRLCPTHHAADLKMKLTPPDELRLVGDDIIPLAALIDESRFFEQPREQERELKVVKLANIPGHSVMYVRWLARAKSKFTVELVSVKGGRDKKEVNHE